MNLLRPFACALVLAALAFCPAVGMAKPQDAVLNKEGYWGIDVDQGTCAASMDVGDGSIFLLRGAGGQVTFAVFLTKPVRRGKTGQVQTEAYAFEFQPSYTDDSKVVFLAGDLDNRALAALRLAKEVRVLVDGRLINAATFENTGFDGALDGLIACSKGEKGWWGAGVGGVGEAAEDNTSESVLNEEGYWALTPGTDPGVCAAAAKVDEHQSFVLMASSDGGLVFGVGSDTKLRRGRTGRFVTDSYAFDFKPTYDSPTYLYSADFLDSAAQFALRRAKTAKITIDGRELVDMTLEGTGHAEVITALAACARGEKGWWGKGAPG